MKRIKARGFGKIYYGWVIVAVIVLATFGQTAQTFPVWGVLLKPMTEEFGWSRTAFTGASSAGTILGALVAVIAGPIIDKFGPRWLTAGSFLIVGGTLVAMAGLSELWHFYFLLILGRTVHLGIVSIVSSAIIPKWFINKGGRAMAIGNIGNRLGSAVTPLYSQVLIGAYGWRYAVIVAGFVTWIISMIPAAMFLKRQPEDLGLRPDGVREQGNLVPPPAGTSEVPKVPERPSLSGKEVIRQPSFYLLASVLSLGFVVGPTTSLHLMAFLTDRALTSQAAVMVVAVASITGIAGSFLFGYLADRTTARNSTIINFGLLSIAFWSLQSIHSTQSAIVWAVYYGVIQGGMFTVVQVILAEYFGRQYLGTIRGLTLIPQSLAQATGPVVVALVYDTSGSYGLVFFTFGFVCLLAALLVFKSSPPLVPREGA